MNHSAKSIRTFIGAKDFNVSRSFYQDLGFKEVPLGEKMSLFLVTDDLGFYLQDYYVKDWVNNSMVFLQIEDVPAYFKALEALELTKKYPTVKLVPIKEADWGRECFIHDPAGVLWHFGEFYN